MSWVTRCPACGTTYKVVPDQLRIAQGWLRCGQCQHAFDSTGVVLPWPEDDFSSGASSSGNDMSAVAAERVHLDELLKQEDRSSGDPVMTAVASFEEALSIFKPMPASPPVSREMSLESVSESDPSQPLLPMVPSASPRSRAALWGAVFLCLAWVLQWLWIERQALALMQPAVGGAWHAVCRVLGCEVGLPQVRDGVVIENSSLTPNDNGWVLVWSVRNATPHRLQMPALELTLLDAQDKALIRRVFLPSQLAAPESLVAGQLWDSQLHLTLEQGGAPAGYRLLTFYP